MIIHYGYSGDTQLVLGLNSSRLLQSNSFFVEKILARDETEQGLVLYRFSEKPKLSLRCTWNLSDHIVLTETYRRLKEFSLWLNKGSRILVTWTAHINDIKDLSLTVIKGESNFVTLQPSNSSAFPVIRNLTYGNMQAEYLINEDDTYCISVENKNPRVICMTMNVDVSSTMYDTTKANSKCPMVNGLCQLKLLFPNTQYILLTTPNNGNINGSVIELYFVARLIIYVTILVIIVVIIMLIFKYLGGYDEPRTPEETTRTEADPLVPGRPNHFTYGTNEEDPDLDSCGSLEDLYEGKICAICYDEQRNCFFVPCGHCATCYECAQRIMDADNKVCPICRRYIHKEGDERMPQSPKVEAGT
ncbi:RING/U-box superfamily protein [Thalictrum thalictroides]|uniref:RING/U-box superfamily protein n=1 Tax=Thalictrum thalictroides TaxID=46969 RepID=A0A7J6VTW3_THATH|nr:RING/U-box superfamily protein [Thalictrum thalictroides]